MILSTHKQHYVNSSIIFLVRLGGTNDPDNASNVPNTYPRRHDRLASRQPIAELRLLAARGVHPKRAVQG